jgi:hypothetical protein
MLKDFERISKLQTTEDITTLRNLADAFRAILF